MAFTANPQTDGAPSSFKIDSEAFYAVKQNLENIGIQAASVRRLLGSKHEQVIYLDLYLGKATRNLAEAELMTVELTPAPSECSEACSIDTIKAEAEDIDIYKNNFLMSTGISKIIGDITERLRTRTDIGSTTMFKTIQLSNKSDIEALVNMIKENIGKDPEFMIDFEAKAKNAVAEYFVRQIHNNMESTAKKMFGL